MVNLVVCFGVSIGPVLTFFCVCCPVAAVAEITRYRVEQGRRGKSRVPRKRKNNNAQVKLGQHAVSGRMRSKYIQCMFKK